MNPNDGVLVPLADRIRWTTVARVIIALLPPVIWLLRPDLRLTTLTPLLAGAALVLTLSVATQPLVRQGRRQALWTIGFMLVVDGAYLAVAFLALHAFAGPVGYVFMLHAIAVTLLTSFRTGLKVVLWHSIVLLVAVEAQMSGLVDGPLTGEPFPTSDFAALLVMLWIATLGTATFAAANERELRRRRYDAEVLRRMAMRLEQDSDVDDVAGTLASVAHEELDAERAAVVVFTEYTATETRTIETFVPGTSSTTRVLAPAEGSRPVLGTAPEAPPTDWQVPEDRHTLGATMARAVSEHRPLLVPALDPVTDPWLAVALPGAQNLLVVPFVLDQQAIGVLALEFPVGRRTWLGKRVAGISRRRIETAEQAVAHAAQAFARAALVSRLRASADTDGLTGIANRRSFDRALDSELARTTRTGLETSVLLTDADHFKAVNDTYGHQVGDDVLRTIADVLRESCRTGDLAARYGGEEFAVILSSTGAEGARAVAERIRRAVTERTRPRVSVSIGIATTLDGLTDPGALVRRADEALYRAKAAGRDRVVSAEQVTLSGAPLRDARP